MSVVTNVVLTWQVGEDLTMLSRVNAYFDNHSGRGDEGIGAENGLKDVGPHAGGTKAFELEIAVGAFNYLDVKEFISHLKSLAWLNRDGVALFVQGQHDDHMSQIAVFPDYSDE